MTTPYRIIVSDCPWKFGDKLPGVRGAESHYKCMTVEELCMLQLPPIADDAILFQWSVASMIEEAITVSHMWGFDKTHSQIVWVKTKKGVDEPEDENDLAFGMGRITRAAHETCLVFTRGKYSKMIKNRSIRSVIFAPRLEHSQKPEVFYQLVEKLVDGEGPFLELFGRRHRPGWAVIGDALGTTLTTMKESAA